MDDSVRPVMRRAIVVVLVLAVAAAAGVPRAGVLAAGVIATPTPVYTAPPTSVVATPTPSGQVLRFTGELLDAQGGFIFFTTGDAFKLAPNAQIINYATGQPATLSVTTRMYAQATFDASGQVVAVALSKKKLPPEAEYAEVHKFAVALSTPVPNPELNPNRPQTGKAASSRFPLTGKIVGVRFYVRVPPTTPLSEPVYMSTDVSGWNPQAIRLERVDALHYAVQLPLRTGTDFVYKYTRGSWQASERGRTGIEEAPRHFFLGASPLGEPDTSVRDDIVYNWSDANPAGGGQAIVPGVTPTPFNPLPFGYPTPFPPKTAPPTTPPRR